MRVHRFAIGRSCPRCGVPPGEPCVFANGYGRHRPHRVCTRPHDERLAPSPTPPPPPPPPPVQALAVACPVCGALPGRDCWNRRLVNTRMPTPHRGRGAP